MINPCCRVSRETESPPQHASVVYAPLLFRVLFNGLEKGEEGGGGGFFHSLIHSHAGQFTLQIKALSDAWVCTVLTQVHRRGCQSDAVCVFGLLVDVAGVVFKGEREGPRRQGQAEWTSLCHRLLFRSPSLRGLRQAGFWKGPPALSR